MPKLRYLSSSATDLREIMRYIAAQSGNVGVARAFVEQIQVKCRQLATLPATMGRPRPELREDLRSVAVGNYVIFFRYVEGFIEIVNVLEAHRDIDAYFNPEIDD